MHSSMVIELSYCSIADRSMNYILLIYYMIMTVTMHHTYAKLATQSVNYCQNVLIAKLNTKLILKSDTVT